MIRPVSDLRNNFADVSRTVHETGEPFFLTKNGFGDMVVLSMDAYEELRFDNYVYDMLFEGEREAEEASETRFSPKEALASMRAVLL